MRGMLYGVGVGPGDPELITRKAERILRLKSRAYISLTTLRKGAMSEPGVSESKPSLTAMSRTRLEGK